MDKFELNRNTCTCKFKDTVSGLLICIDYVVTFYTITQVKYLRMSRNETA